MRYVITTTFTDGREERVVCDREGYDGDELPTLGQLLEELGDDSEVHPGRQCIVRKIVVECLTEREAEGGRA